MAAPEQIVPDFKSILQGKQPACVLSNRQFNLKIQLTIEYKAFRHRKRYALCRFYLLLITVPDPFIRGCCSGGTEFDF